MFYYDVFMKTLFTLIKILFIQIHCVCGPVYYVLIIMTIDSSGELHFHPLVSSVLNQKNIQRKSLIDICCFSASPFVQPATFCSAVGDICLLSHRNRKLGSRDDIHFWIRDEIMGFVQHAQNRSNTSRRIGENNFVYRYSTTCMIPSQRSESRRAVPGSSHKIYVLL